MTESTDTTKAQSRRLFAILKYDAIAIAESVAVLWTVALIFQGAGTIAAANGAMAGIASVAAVLITASAVCRRLS